MKRVVVTQGMMPATWGIHAICYMQVCAAFDASDEEILKTCNRDNLCGTNKGWCHVVREPESEMEKNLVPAVCEQDKGRLHFIVGC